MKTFEINRRLPAPVAYRDLQQEQYARRDLRQTIASKVKAYIATQGPRGARIFAGGQVYDIPPAHERRVTDPTGCGDAFRAGLIFGIEKGYDWPTIGRIGSLMGALKVEHPGTQNQRFDYDEFAEQFRQQFGYAL